MTNVISFAEIAKIFYFKSYLVMRMWIIFPDYFCYIKKKCQNMYAIA